MVVYYLNKVSERLADYRFPIKEGDICMLYDGDAVKTIYVDSETEADSIWRDFKFIDSKSLKSYHFPKTDSVLCAPVGDKHALGDTGLLTQLIQECKGEWLLDFLNETSAVLSGFVDYWDLMVLRRLTGDDDIEIAYGDKEVLADFIDEPDEVDEDELEDEDEYEDDYTDIEILPKSYDIRWFCISVLSCIENQMDKRNYQILNDTLKGDSRSMIASRYNLTQERIRQIIVKAIRQAKELFEEQRKSLEEANAEKAKLRVQLNLLKEENLRLKALLPSDIVSVKNETDENLDAGLVDLLDTPLQDINLPVRAHNILPYLEVKKFVDIPQIKSSLTLLKVRNSGRKTVQDVSRLLEDFHLTYGMSFTEIVETLKKFDWQTARRKWMGDLGKHNQDNINDEHTEEMNKLSSSDDDELEDGLDDVEDSALDELEVEHVFVDSSGRRIDSFTTTGTSLDKGTPTENRRGKPWTEGEEKQLRMYFGQGRDTSTIAAIMGRSEVAIKSRLGMMGLIDYTYGQEDETRTEATTDKQEKEDEGSFTIENSFVRCYILNKRGERAFSENGKLKYIGGKLYQMNLTREVFTLKSMIFNGSVWMKGEKKVLAYPNTELYRLMDDAADYSEQVEDIVDCTSFEDCKLKVNGVWYKYNGNPEVLDDTGKNDDDEEGKSSRRMLMVMKSPLYAVRRQAVLRAMGYFRLPAKIKDIVRTISRTAWGDTIMEEDVEDIINTIQEIELVDGKYILQERLSGLQPSQKNVFGQSPSEQEGEHNAKNMEDNSTIVDERIGQRVRLFPSQQKGEIVRVKIDRKGIKKLVVKTLDGKIVEINDLPYLYEVLNGSYKMEKKEKDKETVSFRPTQKGSRISVGNWIRWKPTGVIGKVVGFVSKGSLRKILIRKKTGEEIEVYDNPKAYEIVLK